MLARAIQGIIWTIVKKKNVGYRRWQRRCVMRVRTTGRLSFPIENTFHAKRVLAFALVRIS